VRIFLCFLLATAAASFTLDFRRELMLLPRKTALTIATLGAFAIVPAYLPEFANWKGIDWRTISSIWDLPVPEPEIAAPAPVRIVTGTLEQQPSYLLDPQGQLDSFYAALLRIEEQKPDARVRVLHYGDSPTTADMITADVRDLLQQRFGNGGHGFVLIGRPWAWYSHRGIDLATSGFRMDPATTGELRDGLHGIGGVSFRGNAGATARWKLSDKDHSFAEIAYLKQPGGGTFEVRAGEEVVGKVETAGEKAPGFASVVLPPETSTVTLKVTDGTVRLYGVAFTRANRGIVYDSLGLNGAYTTVLARMFNADHWAEQLRHYDPDLVVINYGTNESMYPKWVDSMYAKEAQEVLRRVRAALPGVPILLMSPMDRGQRNDEGEIVTPTVMPRLVRMQAEIAAGSGVAFFDTFSAMGGNGTMGRWYNRQPRLVSADYMHPLPGGARIVGSLLYDAFMNGYNQYKVRQVLKRHALNTNPAQPDQPPAKVTP
jgi:lysophospholipase L1-like esterase